MGISISGWISLFLEFFFKLTPLELSMVLIKAYELYKACKVYPFINH